MLAMQAHWSLAQLVGYLRTWSATQAFIAVNGADPIEPIISDLSATWRSPNWQRLGKLAAHHTSWTPDPLKQSGAGRLATHPFLSTTLLLLFVLRNDFVEFKDWQEHRDDDTPDDYAEKNNEHRLDQ